MRKAKKKFNLLIDCWIIIDDETLNRKEKIEKIKGLKKYKRRKIMKNNKNMLYVVLKEIFKKIKNFNLDQFSKFLIKLDAANYNLTPVIETLHGLNTPYLENRLQELIIFNILNQTSSIYYTLTKEGVKYINEQTKLIYENDDYKDFIETTNKLIDKIFMKKD